MRNNNLQRQQIGAKLHLFQEVRKVAMPPTGWIKAIRLALGMSLAQLGSRLSITKQSVKEMETREAEGNITLRTLREAAAALEMELVYGLVPNRDGSLDALIHRKAKDLVIKIVLHTANTMNLEDQGNSQSRLEKAIQERTEEIEHSMPKSLWD